MVTGYKERKGTHTAFVRDNSGKFTATAVMKGNVLEEVSCTCSYHKTKKYCKHIAALLFRVEKKIGDIISSEENPDSSQDKKKELYQKLVYNDDGKPRFLSFGTSLDVYRPGADALAMAKRIIKQGNVYQEKTELEIQQGEPVLIYSVVVRVDYRESARVTIVLTHTGIKEITCRDNTSYSERKISVLCDRRQDRSGIIELCCHKTAALLSFIKYMEKNRDTIDFTDSNASLFIDDFRNDRKEYTFPEDEEEPVIDIEPEINDKDLVLHVAAGNGTIYKVRDIDDFYDHWIDRDFYKLYMSYGVDFSKGVLSERGQKVMDLIRATGNYCYINNRQNYSDSIYLYDTLPYTKVLDDFYEIMKGTTIVYKGKPLQGFRDTDPTFNMKIKEIREGDKAEGIYVSGEISGRWRTAKYIYWIQDGWFNRTPASKLGPAESLIKTADSRGHFSFIVGLENIDNFYRRILPSLKRYGDVEDEAEPAFEALLMDVPEPVFYVDCDNKWIICMAVFLFEGKEEQVYPRDGHHITDVRNENEKLRPFGDDLALELAKIFPDHYSWEGYWLVQNNEDEAYDFLKRGLGMLKQLGEVRITDSVKNMTVRKMPKITSFFDIDENNSSVLDLSLDLQGFTIEELSEILRSYSENKKYHRLENGDFISFGGVNLDSLSALFSSSGISLKSYVDGRMHIPLYRALYLDQILKEQRGISYTGGERFRKLIDEFNTTGDVEYEVPSSLESVMRSYQKDGYRWLRMLFGYGFGGILADDMGLGKTVQALALLQSLKDEGESVSALIVSPASLVYNWKAECRKFTPSLKAVAVTGTAAERKAVINNHDSYDILITSYDLLKRDILLYDDIVFNVEIIDAAQFIKNHNTAAAKSVKAVKSSHRLALTGTPIENRLSELWSIFEFLMPGFLFSQEKFRTNFSSPIEKNGDMEAAEKLKKLTGPFILRRLKTDVLKDLPDKIEETRMTPLEGEQKKLYTAEVARAKGMLKKSRNYNEQKIEILAELMKIRQICCDPSLVFEDYKGSSSKREAVMDLVESAIDGGHRILLFSQFTSMLELLEKDFSEKKIEYYKITGSTEKAKRLELVDSFNRGTTPLFLISLKAGGTGLNLTGADIVIHYDPWWNTAAQDQATDRAHRIGQTKRVTVYRMIAGNTIEEKIMLLQETKKHLADEIVSTENLSLSSLSKDDLMELLSISEM